ncbi:peptidoglycan-binding domain-containing protein [Marinicaulis aureus]|uniref:Peptidoglycan-binding domain-containing protein n=1 Tax=Hyphococcus aureus TaxID=2666033 RepID=A0ABW1KXW7_9PROT
MKIKDITAMLTGAALLGLTSGAFAEDWNDKVVEDALAKSGEADKPFSGDSVAARLYQEMLVESERTQRSGVRIMEQTKLFKHLGQLPQGASPKVYLAAVDLQTPDGKTYTEMVPLSPEEVERLKMEAAGTAPDEVAAALDGMSKGMVLLGESLRASIADSKYSGSLSKKSSFAWFGTGYGGGFDQKCAAYLDAVDQARVNEKARGQGDKFNDRITQQSVGIVPEVNEETGVATYKIDPSAMMLSPSCVLAVAAAGMREPGDSYKDVRNRAIEQFNKDVKVLGRETIEGYQTDRISIDGLSFKQTADDGSEVMIERLDVWLDPKFHKRRKMRMEGVIKQDGEIREIFIERENRDYRRVGSSVMYEPYMEIVKVGGVMDEKQKKELAKAQKQLEELDKKLASMPASQRAMMENMVGPQIEQLRNMTESGAVTMEIVTSKIEINPDLGDDGAFYAFFGGGAGKLPTGENNTAVIQAIQLNLAKLGYAPGSATGQMTDATRTAISTYQADRGLAVIGEPSPELAQALQADVNAQ